MSSAISGVHLENFKAHAQLNLKLPALTVLVGQNNTGKSAVLHAIALAKYGARFDQLLPIGQGTDLLYDDASVGQIELTLQAGVWSARIDREPFRYQVRWSGTNETDPARKLYYLSALRAGSPAFNYQQITSDVGVTGEQTWNILHQLKANDKKEFLTILEWAKGFGLGISGLGIPTMGASGAVTPETYGYRTNLILHGSGTWSVLPIIVQGVLCGDRDVLLVEEPESHLHRAAIDALSRFFGNCAERGVQVVCTTHSMDLLASMNERIEEGTIPKDTAVYVFRRTREGTIKVDDRDLSVFRQIREFVKKELAGQGM